jgi:hypothetical protein
MEHAIDRSCITYEEKRNMYRVWVGKSEEITWKN